MKVPIVVPTLEKIYGWHFVSHFNKNFTHMNIEEIFNQVQKDAKEKEIEVNFSVEALYAPLRVHNIAYKKRPKGRQADPNALPKPPRPLGGERVPKASPVFDKFISDLGGLEETKKYLGELVLEGISLKIALERINEKTKGNYAYGNISYFAKKLHMDFEKGRKGNPNLGKNRPSPILDSFLSNFKDEDEAKTYLQSLTHLSLNEALEEVNKKIENEISYSNLISFAKKWDFEFKRLKAKKGEGKNHKPITGEVEMNPEQDVILKEIVKIRYKCKECGELKAVKKHGLELPLGLRAMRCHHCSKWGTYTATVITENGTRHFSIIPTSGLSDNVKIYGEEEVDENLNLIEHSENQSQTEIVSENELQSV